MNESLQELQSELERLANRVKMQRVRNVTEHGSGPKPAGNGAHLPDPYTDPDAWRAAVNRKMAEAKMGMKL